MKDKDLLRLEQLDRALAPYLDLAGLTRPKLGWVRAIREALGMSSPQLAKRLRIRAAQSVEDMQKDEATGAITLKTLGKVAEALDCQLVYVFVPRKPLHDILRERATEIARAQLARVSHSMKLEEQGVSSESEQSALNRRVDRLLSGNPKKLWD
ncbi:MAG TPA: mobile mystery protein A [Blastocatellia bacterium]|jgi:predicted DNA-binding mobile mystery protein A|nr:mobile mystery protein A [Blastocatellia bacterium]